jgi:pantothenate kinase
LKSFNSNQVQTFIDFVKEHKLLDEAIKNDGDSNNQIDSENKYQAIIHATGGGAYKYADLFEKEFEGKVKLNKYDEMQSLVDGMIFVLSFAKNP